MRAVFSSILRAEHASVTERSTALFTRSSESSSPKDAEVQPDSSENTRVLSGALAFNFDQTIGDGLAGSLQKINDIKGAAGAGAEQNELHGPRSKAAATDLGGSVEGER